MSAKLEQWHHKATEAERAAHSRVTLSNGVSVELMSRSYLDRMAGAVPGGGLLFLGGCGQPLLRVAYEKEQGLLVILCAECGGNLGAVKVAADA